MKLGLVLCTVLLIGCVAGCKGASEKKDTSGTPLKTMEKMKAESKAAKGPTAGAGATDTAEKAKGE